MNNNKSTIIGWVLIAAVMVGFIWINKPSEEQLAEQARLKAEMDSLTVDSMPAPATLPTPATLPAPRTLPKRELSKPDERTTRPSRE